MSTVKRNLSLCLILVFLVLLLPLQSAQADAGFHPTMDFSFAYKIAGAKPSILSGTLYMCHEPDCSDAKPLESIGDDYGFKCTATSCHALAKGFRDYEMLEIQFSDGITRRSNIFEEEENGFDSKYLVTVRQSDLLVEKRFHISLFSKWTYVALCGICLTGIIIVVVSIITNRRKRKQKR